MHRKHYSYNFNSLILFWYIFVLLRNNWHTSLLFSHSWPLFTVLRSILFIIRMQSSLGFTFILYPLTFLPLLFIYFFIIYKSGLVICRDNICSHILFFFFFISWRLITLQYCSGFCHTLTWISHGFTCIPHPDPPSHLPLYPILLGFPSAPAQFQKNKLPNQKMGHRTKQTFIQRRHTDG